MGCHLTKEIGEMNGERKVKGIGKSASEDASDQCEGANRSELYPTKNGNGICHPTQEGRNRQADTCFENKKTSIAKRIFGGLLSSLMHGGECGTYPHELAETKVVFVAEAARENGFPLKTTIEPQ